jgi:phosphotransferase system  glucose/maltose/N-acetylglucosamine-specific IIC component
MKKLLLILTIAISFGACKKDAGTGGLASIEGHIAIQRRAVLSNANTIIDTVSGLDKEVYLVYGDHLSPDEKVVTNYNGDFSFTGLRPGEYTVYLYSKDTLGSSSTNPDHMVVKEILKVVSRKESVDAGTLMIYDLP